MAYFERTKRAAGKYRGNALGPKLAFLATRTEFSVQRIASCTGATRQTVYGWFRGRSIAPFYRPRVSALLSILETSPNSEAAWSAACQVFNLNNSPTKNSSATPA